MKDDDLHDDDLTLLTEPEDAGSDADSEELWNRLDHVPPVQN